MKEQTKLSYSLTEIMDWLWSFEVGQKSVDAKPIDEIKKELE